MYRSRLLLYLSWCQCWSGWSWAQMCLDLSRSHWAPGSAARLTGRARGNDRMKRVKEKKPAREEGQMRQEEMITREKLVDTLTNWHTYLLRYLTAAHATLTDIDLLLPASHAVLVKLVLCPEIQISFHQLILLSTFLISFLYITPLSELLVH